MSFTADIAIERRNIAMSALESAFQKNYIANNVLAISESESEPKPEYVLANSKYNLKTKKVHKQEKTIYVIDNVQIEGPFAVGDTGRSDPLTYQDDDDDNTVCSEMFHYLSRKLTDEESFEYRAIAEPAAIRKQDETFDFIIVGAAAVFRNESLRSIVEIGKPGYENFGRYSRQKAYMFLERIIKKMNIKQISHVHAFCGNDDFNGVGEPLMKEIKRREARAANHEYCLIVLWSVPEAVGFYEKQEFKCVTPKNVDEWQKAFYNWKGTKDAPEDLDDDFIQDVDEDDINQVFMYCVVRANPQKLKRQRDET